MSKNNLSIVESILFATGKPVKYKEIISFVKIKEKGLKEIISDLKEKYNTNESGVHILDNNNKLQLVTNPDNGKVMQEYFVDEITGELSRPALETLTIISYRQPISKEELEQIRGVNCSLILRNLLIRGFVESKSSKGGLLTNYSVTTDFLRHLGIDSVKDLPDYEKLNSDDNLQSLINSKDEE